jgi:hypothetical protein
LFTLSDRFIIALWTNPPMPLVGEEGREVDGAGISDVEGVSFGGSKAGDLVPEP